MPKPKMAQLTIFYAGSVNVFNNVSPEKVRLLCVDGWMLRFHATVAISVSGLS
jgi:hypothetical protein